MKFYVAMDTDKLEWFGPTAALLERMGHSIFPIYEDGIPDGSQSQEELETLLNKEIDAILSADAVVALSPLDRSTKYLLKGALHCDIPVLYEQGWDPDIGPNIEYAETCKAAVIDVITEPIVKSWLAKVCPSHVQTRAVIQ